MEEVIIQMDAENTYRVNNGLWTSGQLSEKDIQLLPGMGFNLVINLALPSSERALPNEASLVTGTGIAYVQIPVIWEQPLPAQFQQFAGVLQTFEGSKIWVHCVMNMRVSAFVYLYRKCILGESAENASFPMRHIWQPDEVWKKFMEEVSLLYTGQSDKK